MSHLPGISFLGIFPGRHRDTPRSHEKTRKPLWHVPYIYIYTLEVQPTKESGWSLGSSMVSGFPILPMGSSFGRLGLPGYILMSWESKGPTPPMPRGNPQEIAGLIFRDYEARRLVPLLRPAIKALSAIFWRGFPRGIGGMGPLGSHDYGFPIFC